MATLFFEGFNLSNSDGSPYIDPRYWTLPSIFNPKLTYNNYIYNNDNSIKDVNIGATQGSLNISGYRLETIPPQFATPLQLSGVSGLDSDQLYISFRIRHLSFNDTVSQPPHTAKLLTFCYGNNETLSIDVVKTIGPSIQGGTWIYGSSDFSESGIGLSVKQSGNEIGLFDLRIGDINNYYIKSDSSSLSPQIISKDMFDLEFPRFTHLEFLIDRQNNKINIMLEGMEIQNSLSAYPYSIDANTQPLGIINNIKFYNKGFSDTAFSSNSTAQLTIDDLVICNNSGNTPNTWIGPKARIFHMINENATFNLQGWKKAYGSLPENEILNSKDGDNSYIYSDSSGDITSFNIKNSLILNSDKYNTYIHDGIGGIRLFNDARKTFLNSDFINVYCVGDVTDSGNYITIGDQYTADRRNYVIKNSFIFNDPISGDSWNSGTFFEYDGSNYRVSGSWGIKKL